MPYITTNKRAEWAVGGKTSSEAFKYFISDLLNNPESVPVSVFLPERVYSAQRKDSCITFLWHYLQKTKSSEMPKALLLSIYVKPQNTYEFFCGFTIMRSIKLPRGEKCENKILRRGR